MTVKKLGRNRAWYAYYSRDVFICQGTLQDISEYTGKSIRCLRCYIGDRSPNFSIVRIEKEDGDDV